MSGIYKGINRGVDKIVKVIKNGEIIWRQSSNKRLAYQALGGGYYKMQTVPGRKYLVTLNAEDPFDIGTKQYGMDIRNSYTSDKVINFTASTKETHFKIYRNNVEIVSIEEV